MLAEFILLLVTHTCFKFAVELTCEGDTAEHAQYQKINYSATMTER